MNGVYFPILRGRQFELIALRECVENRILSRRIIPVVEPVKPTSSYTKTIDAFIEDGRSIAVICNPQVGSWEKKLADEGNLRLRESAAGQMEASCVIPSFYVTSDLADDIRGAEGSGRDVDSLLLICDNPECLDIYDNVIGDRKPMYNLIPDKGEFRRRIRTNRVICEDHFPKKDRNSDYSGIETEFFSSDHLYYKDDGYVGFSDYSVVGREYTDIGFAPYAVAVHIVYFDEKNNLRIAHFVSDSNEDISDPAGKYMEALGKLVEWNKTRHINTLGMRAFEETYRNESYPGLGVVKKYSIMHHLELMSGYLDGGTA